MDEPPADTGIKGNIRREDRIWTCMPRAFATRRSTSWRTSRYVF